jgi:hypothetical protein
MAVSVATFDRWIAVEPRTWSLIVFLGYDRELIKSWETFHTSRDFTYKGLKAADAQWGDKPTKHFKTTVHANARCETLKEWSDAFNVFGNWINLSVALTLASNLETYLASVVRLSLDSDPALLLGTSKAVDGATVLKYGHRQNISVSELIEQCTKGTWSSRLSALESMFGKSVAPLQAIHGSLEELRKFRNRFGHAFGRDIEKARAIAQLELQPVQNLSREKVEKMRSQIVAAVRKVDSNLLNNHIGDYEILVYLSRLQVNFKDGLNAGQRAANLKKSIGGYGAKLRGKKYCNELVKYWDSL